MSFLMEVLFEVIAQLVFELLGEAAEHSFGRRRPTNKWVAYVRCIFLGSFVGLLATAVIPEPLLGRRITGISFFLARNPPSRAIQMIASCRVGGWEGRVVVLCTVQ